jgi:hypothetical protein
MVRNGNSGGSGVIMEIMPLILEVVIIAILIFGVIMLGRFVNNRFTQKNKLKKQ